MLIINNNVYNFTDKNGNKADYYPRWETIYVDSKFNGKELEDIKKELEKDGYKVVHVVGIKEKHK